MKRFMRGLLVVAALTAGTLGVTGTPAFAIGGCNGQNTTIGPCIDWQGGDNDPTRGDFYLNRTPDSSVYAYRFAIVTDGVFHWVQNTKEVFTHTGRYTKSSWYVNTNMEPTDQRHTAYSQVIVYTKTGVIHMTVNSPTITYTN